MVLNSKELIVMGDLNCEPNDDPIMKLKMNLFDSYEISIKKPYGPNGTFNGFNTTAIPKKRIDYILTKNLEVDKFRIVDDRRRNGLFLSDHFPVLVFVEQCNTTK